MDRKLNFLLGVKILIFWRVAQPEKLIFFSQQPVIYQLLKTNTEMLLFPEFIPEKYNADKEKINGTAY